MIPLQQILALLCVVHGHDRGLLHLGKQGRVVSLLGAGTVARANLVELDKLVSHQFLLFTDLKSCMVA